MKIKVSDFVARFLEERSIRHVFGIVGAGNAHLFDSINYHGFTKIICVHHEQAACMAAQTYYRTSGKPVVALLTTGAGSLNAVTGVVSAWADSIPMLAVSSNEKSTYCRPENPLRMWGVQGYDSVEMVRKVTKYAMRVTDPKRIRYELEKAYHIALAGRPGPCWIDVPMDVQAAQVEESELLPFAPDGAVGHAAEARLAPGRVQALWDAVRDAKRPLLWLGHGIRLAGAQELLPRLLEFAKLPCLVSWAGIDMIDSSHPLVFGRAGVYGGRAANFVLQNCDFLLTIGTRLAIPQVGYEIGELAGKARIVSIDIDPAELQKYPERIEGLLSDAGLFLRESIDLLSARPIPSPPDWLRYCEDVRSSYPTCGPEHADRDGFINSYGFIERLNTHLKPDQVIVTDMGTALLSGHQGLKLKSGQRLMTSTGLGEMGFGLPGAIGASFARDGGEVLCLNCDGGMMLNLQELQTVVHHRLPIKIIIFNNDGYLMIKHTQKAIFKGRYAGTDKRTGVSCPDYSKVAEAFGMPAFQVRDWTEFEAVIPRLQSYDGPAICEVFMSPEQFFHPKQSVAARPDGTLVSPPLEDLSPLLPRAELKSRMLVGMHPKSTGLAP